MSGAKNIRVAVRLRPFNEKEMGQNQRNIVKVLDESTLIFDPDDEEDEFFFHGVKHNYRDITKRMNKKLTMEYDDVFDHEKTNMDVFNSCTKPMIKSVMDGYNCSVFVYGATGAGKTFTMLGCPAYPGITYLTMKELFRHIESLSDDRKFDIRISYLEVYNELVMNLLTKSGPLKLREDANGVVVSGLVLKPISSADELLQMLALGNQNRTQHATDANAESSRSHAIFQVHIKIVEKKTGQKRAVKLSMIDLAGSERAASTKGIGIRFKEGANINKSLLALGNCINKLADGLKHIPYRDSNLTRILKDSLGGNCQTVMIANISPSSLTYEDTYNTLKYASRAKKIRTTLRQNILPSNVPKEFLVKKVNEQNDVIERLKAKIREMEENKQLLPPVRDENEINNWKAKVEHCYSNIRQAQKHYFTLKSKVKILALRVMLKEQAKSVTHILTLHGSHLKADIAKLEASIEQYKINMARQQEEINGWEKRYKEKRRMRDALRTEVSQSSVAQELLQYIAVKDSELKSSKTTLKWLHIFKINEIYNEENKHWEKTMQLSGEIVQQNYLLLRSIDRLDNVTLERMENLVKLNSRQRGVKFSDDSEQQEMARQMDITDESIFDITNLSDCSDNEHQQQHHRETEDDAMELQPAASNDRKAEQQATVMPPPKKPKAARTLDLKPKVPMKRKTPTKPPVSQFKVPKLMITGPPANHAVKLPKAEQKVAHTRTQSSSSSDSTDNEPSGGDATFCIEERSGSSGSLFSPSLVDCKVQQKVLDRALHRASMRGTVKNNKVSLSINKENRKYISPKRIGKSPRTISRFPNRPTATPASIINRYRQMKGAMSTAVIAPKPILATSNSTSNNNNNNNIAAADSNRNRHPAQMRDRK